MKLLIISNMDHYINNEVLLGWGPTVEELNYLSSLFTHVYHIAFLHDEEAPASALPYASNNLTFMPIPPSGGNSFSDKLGIIKKIPIYLKTISQIMKTVDAVHLRCPASIPLLALFVLMFKRKPIYRWAKFAGNWDAGNNYPFFFRLQHWILEKKASKCVVTINGSWPGQKPHIHTFNNPCLTNKELVEAKKIADAKEMQIPLRLIFVGALKESKGVGRLLQIALLLKQKGIQFNLDVLGDGPLRCQYEQIIHDQQLESQVRFCGWIPKNKVGEYYAKAHFNIFPSESEGWPKVLSEGMAYGVVPVAGAISSIPQVLADTKSGISVPCLDINSYVNQIVNLMSSPDTWKYYSTNAILAAERFTYEYYLEAVKNLFTKEWQVLL